MSLTRPLGLTRHLRRPDLRLEVVPWLNVLLVGWLLSLLGSRFVYAPGLAVNLPAGTASLPTQLDLPVLAGGPLPGRAADAVLTVLNVKQNPPNASGDAFSQAPWFIFQGRIYDNIEALRTKMHTLPRPPPGVPSILLFKASRDVDMQTFVEVCDLARAAGFTVQIAVESAANANSSVAPGAP